MKAKELRILVVFYSMTGNTAKLAKAVAKGAEQAGAEVRLRQAQELIPKENFNENMRKVKEELKDVPVATNEDLEWADGIAFGTPTRYGNMSAQMKNFIDQTGKLWQEGKLINKIAGFFTSTATLHGGQETIIVSSMIPMFHHGMIIVGVPYSEQELFRKDFGGGSPYGASSVGLPNEVDLRVAEALGKRLAELSKKLK